MNWKTITSEADLKEIVELSTTTSCLIYKHSTRCTMSEMMKYVLEEEWNFEEDEMQPYYLDILAHKSPQILLIQNGECTYDEDHQDISVEDLREHLEDETWKF